KSASHPLARGRERLRMDRKEQAMAQHTASKLQGRKLQGREVVIVEAARTPIGRGHPEKGWFRDLHPNELLGAAYNAAIARAGIEPEVVEDVVAGAVTQVGEQSNNIARNAWLQA